MKVGICKNIISPSSEMILLIILIFSSSCITAQQRKIDSLKHAINSAKADTLKIILLEQLGQSYRDEKKIDSGIMIYKQALELNEKINYSLLNQRWELACIDYMSYVTGNYAESLKYALQELEVTEKMNDKFHMGYVYLVFGHNYKELSDYRKSLNTYFKAKQFFTLYNQSEKEPEVNTYTNLCISEVYLKMNQPDSALLFAQQAYKMALADPIHSAFPQGNSVERNYILYSMRVLGDIYFMKGYDQTGLNYYRQYISGFINSKENNRDLGFVFINMSKIFQKRGQNDSAVFYSKKALSNAQEYHDEENIYSSATVLYNFYNNKNNTKKIHGTRNSLNSMDNLKQKDFIKNDDGAGVKTDSLKKLIANTKRDTAKIDLYEKLGQAYRDDKKMDSSILSYQQAVEINKKYNYSLQKQCWDVASIDFILNEMGNYTESLKYASLHLELSKELNDTFQKGFSHLVFGHDYRELGEYRQSLNHYFKAKEFFKLYWLSRNKTEDNTYTMLCISETYLKMNNLDSALIYAQQAYKIAVADSDGGLILLSERIFGDIYSAKGDSKTALNYYRQYIPDYIKYKGINRDLGFVLNSMAKIFQKTYQNDSAVFYAKKALANAGEFQDQENIYNASDFLYRLHDSLKDESQAFMYFKIAAAAKDSMINLEKIKQIQILTSNEQTREKVQAEADAKEAARIKLSIIIAAFLVSVISFLIWNRIKQLRLKHKMILEQKEAEKLKAIDKMKEKFFSNITHELRTPLSLILSPAEFYLAHPEELNDTNKFLKSIYKNSSYLLNLINQLLDISKLDAGKMIISLSKGDFGNYIGALTETFEDEALKKQIVLHFKNNLEGDYLFDEEHWKKIINNILGNALKFTPAGGDVSININKISGSTEASTIQLVVKDTGIGIDEEHIPFITDRFYQADNKLSRKYEGAGIGLALVNELAKLMDGELTIRSEVNNGSEFIITATLLRANGKEDHSGVKPVARSFQLLHNDSNYTNTFKGPVENIPVILVTEDNDELREFLKDSIEPLYKVITAKDGNDGFEKALSQIPDLMISDVMMPVMDGFEFCNKIKTNPSTSHVPFIILSSKTTYESKIAGLEKGADDFITKPFSVDELRAKIKNILSRQEQLRKRYLDQLIDENPLPSASEMQNEFLKNTFRIIEEHIDDSQLSVEFLAAKLDLDNNALNRKSSFLIGLSANELIRQYRVKKEKMEHQMLELEAKALRAQMNPHFIFNCMNSIKSLIQQNDQDKAVTYLTTFSKLLRTVFQNSDKREISLFDEIETCKLYTQLESMRFSNKFNYHFKVDETIDLKSVQVPALIIQPFIENAIWHGIVPKTGGGTVMVTIEKRENNICCIIDDDGIGRETSQQNKFRGEPSTHQSKGVHLTQSRLDLDNALNQRNRSVVIIDKKDEDEKSKGTTVILTFKEY